MKTKRIVKMLGGSLLTLFTLSGCSGFLEVDKIGQTTIPVLFSDVEGIRAARVGAYEVMFNFYNGELPAYPEVAGDLAAMPAVGSGSQGVMLNQYNFQSTQDDATTAVGHIWKNGYEAMANINNILQFQPEILQKFPANAAELKRIKAEALFLRALCHFELCRVFAQPYNYTTEASHPGIPVLIRTPKTGVFVGRSSVAKVYEQIENDLEESISDFGNSTPANLDAYHASKVTSQALLCRVALYKGDWAKTVALADSVLAVVPIAYGDDYLNMYNANMAGKEAIFRLNGLKQNATLANYYKSVSPIIYGSDSLLSLYEPQDIRLNLFSKNSNINQSLKYSLPTSIPETEKHYDPFVLRASEILLNRAEAYLNLNKPDQAADDLKMLIARNMKKDVSAITLPSDVESLWLVLRKERAKELCFEGHQFYDLTRWKLDIIRPANTSSLVKRINYPSDWFVLPIPIAEIQANPAMEGNPTVNK